MATENRAPKARDDDQSNEQRFRMVREVAAIAVAVVFWFCLDLVLPETWRKRLHWFDGAGEPD